MFVIKPGNLENQTEPASVPVQRNTMSEEPLPGTRIDRALRPCPFCSSQNADVSFYTEREPTQALCFVICRTCFATGPVTVTTEKARAAWNLRH